MFNLINPEFNLEFGNIQSFQLLHAPAVQTENNPRTDRPIDTFISH